MQPTRQEIIDRIYEVVKPAYFKRRTYPIEYVMIWDILDRIDKNERKYDTSKYSHEWTENYNIMEENESIHRRLMDERKYKRDSLEYQPDDCITFIYNLLPQSN